MGQSPSAVVHLPEKAAPRVKTGAFQPPPLHPDPQMPAAAKVESIGVQKVEPPKRVEAIKAQPVAATVRLPSQPPTCGGRQPQPGNAVWFWMKDAVGQLVARPAWLLEFNTANGKWILNVMRFGSIYGQRDIVFSDTPADCCWTWQEVPQTTAATSAEVKTEVKPESKPAE